jgi:hypothetical protein
VRGSYIKKRLNKIQVSPVRELCKLIISMLFMIRIISNQRVALALHAFSLQICAPPSAAEFLLAYSTAIESVRTRRPSSFEHDHNVALDFEHNFEHGDVLRSPKY